MRFTGADAIGLPRIGSHHHHGPQMFGLAGIRQDRRIALDHAFAFEPRDAFLDC